MRRRSYYLPLVVLAHTDPFSHLRASPGTCPRSRTLLGTKTAKLSTSIGKFFAEHFFVWETEET